MPDKCLTAAPAVILAKAGIHLAVIPAQAGIQWFNQDIPARAGMPAVGFRLVPA